MKIKKTWQLPQPDAVDGEYEWLSVVRVGRVIPFGYRQDPEDSDIPVSYTHLTLPTIYSV